MESETPADVTPDGYLSPEQILTHVETHYLTIDEAIAALHDRGIDSDNFDVPWNTDCPF